MKTRFFLAPVGLCAMAFLSAGCPSSTPTDNVAVPTDNTASGNTATSNTASTDNTATGNTATVSATEAPLAPHNKAAASKPVKLAFVCNNASDYWTIARKGVEAAQKEYPNIDVNFQTPDQGTAAQQTQIVNDLLAKGVQGIAISPVDPANQTDLIDKVSKQALVFTQDSDAPKSDRSCYVGTDNVAAGRLAGQQLVKALPNGGNVMVFVGKIDAQNAADRYKGLQDGIKGSKIKILDVRTDQADHAVAKSNVADTITKYPDLAGCVGLWSYNGPAILNAVKEANKVGKIQIVCFDEEPDTLIGVKSGGIAATIVQQPYKFGYLAVVNMAADLNGDKSVVPASKQAFVDAQVITASNVDAFKAKLDIQRGHS